MVRSAAAVAVLLATARCASGPRRVDPPAPRPSPERAAQDRATEAFRLGKEAALSGDFSCAEDYFGRAIEAVRPAGTASPASPEVLAFSTELFESILRYEALAAPVEDAAAAEDHIAPELRKIETPVASQEAISAAATAVASDSGGEASDVPIVVNDAVLKVMAVFQNDLHDVIGRGIARSGRYLPMIHRVFEEEGIPKDLAQVALVESSFIPHARSPKAAHGIWQFMPRTGRQYGLTSNATIDERSDPEKATRAAARHLRYLHVLFHDWYLAMAAYNAGEGKVLKAMARTGFSDFWQLAASGALRSQTVSYVPAVLAATLIMKNPAHYGFDIEYEKPLAYETVELKRPVHLKSLATAQAPTLEDLQQLNPELRTDVTPRDPDGYELKVPPGTRDLVLAAYSAAPTAVPPSVRRHATRRGETLASIARRFRVPLAELEALNGLPARSGLPRGRVVLIPMHPRERVASKRIKPHSPVAARQEKPAPSPRTYRVRGGDTLYRIALRHGTTVALLMTLNSLGTPSIRPGDLLKVPSKGSP